MLAPALQIPSPPAEVPPPELESLAVVEPARAVNSDAAERQLPRVWAAQQAQPRVEAPSAFAMVE